MRPVGRQPEDVPRRPGADRAALARAGARKARDVHDVPEEVPMAPTHPRLAALLTAAVLATGAVAGCGDEEEPATAGEPAPTQEASPVDEAGETNLTMRELLRDPEAYVNEEVTVTGEVVDTIVEPGAFTIGTTGAGNDEALIVLPTADAQIPQDTVERGDVVIVRGAVETVTDADPDRFLYGEAEPEAGFLGSYLDRPGIVASSVDVGDTEG